MRKKKEMTRCLQPPLRPRSDGWVAKSEEKSRGLKMRRYRCLPTASAAAEVGIGEPRGGTKKWSPGEGHIVRRCGREVGGCAEETKEKSMGCIDHQRRRCILGILGANGAAAAADSGRESRQSVGHR